MHARRSRSIAPASPRALGRTVLAVCRGDASRPGAPRTACTLPHPSSLRPACALALCVGALLKVDAATAQTSSAALPAVTVERSTGLTDDALVTPLQTGSRLGVSSLDTPASVERIDAAQIDARADRTVSEAVSRATGFTSDAAPGNGGTALTVRGFSGHESVMTLYDGTRLFVGSGTVTYPFDTWSVASIEVLRGPASVLYGEGGLGGAVNVVPKRPQAVRATTAEVGVGTRGTRRVAIDTTGPVNEVLDYRFYLSDNRSDGWVARGDSHSTAVGAALAWHPSATFHLTLSYDYGRQRPMRNFGVPVTDGALDTALRHRNYNVGDADIRYRDQWLHLDAQWRAAPGLTLRNQTYGMASDRHWRDAESYALDPQAGLVSRSDFIAIGHRERQLGDRLDATFDGTLFGRANRLVLGGEVDTVRFDHANNSPYGGSDTVPANGYVSGAFDSPDAFTPAFHSRLNQAAVFIEDRYELTPRLALVGALRYDRIAMHRDDLRSDTAFSKHFARAGGRAGLVFAATPDLSFYAQASEGADGVGSLLSLSASQSAYRLAHGRQVEAGIKQVLPAGHGYWTLAAYRIVKHDLLSTDPLDPTVQQQVGQQSSRGLEWSGLLHLGPALTLEANAAWLRARYDDFRQASGGGTVSRAGNVPVNIPQRTANIWLSWHVAPDWRIGAGWRHVGARYGDAANRERLPSYNVIDASARWQVSRRTSLSLRLRNLFNRTYPLTSLNGGSQWLLGPARSAELVASVTF